MNRKINWQMGDKAIQMQIKEPGTNLLDLYRKNRKRLCGPEENYDRYGIEAACGGSGICGKCKVQVVQGGSPVTSIERQYLTRDEIAAGYRLACQVTAAGSLTVRLLPKAGRLIQTPEISQSESRNLQKEKNKSPQAVHTAAAEYAIAVDLGTTTLAAALVDLDAKAVVKQAAAVNTQYIYGADVLSRIRASNEGKKEALRTAVCMDLQKLFQKLLTGFASPGCHADDRNKSGGKIRISKIAVSGNTVMLHLLRGYSCEKLGEAPFTPVNLERECLSYGEVFGQRCCEAQGVSKAEQDKISEALKSCRNSSVYLLPGLSAFVGADILAGLYSSGFLQTPENELAVFLDLGTNGELAVGNGTGFFSAAAAAGPVFEGGSLSCGMPGVPGAVSSVSYLYHRVRIQTIGQKKPLGICGTGALEAAAALLQEGLMDKNGLLSPELFETGMVLGEKADGTLIRLTQTDIRKIQMAKAAIRAAVETLLLRYQEERKTVQKSPGKIYLAGGFGYYLSAKTAAAAGLLPAEWAERTAVCGNTSLKGAVSYLTEPDCAAVLDGLREKNCGLSLAEDPYFQEAYMQNIPFPLV